MDFTGNIEGGILNQQVTRKLSLGNIHLIFNLKNKSEF